MAGLVALFFLVAVAGISIWSLSPEPDPVRKLYVLNEGVDSLGVPKRTFYIVTYPTSSGFERIKRLLGNTPEPPADLPPELAELDSLKPLSDPEILQFISEITKKNMADIALQRKGINREPVHQKLSLPDVQMIELEEFKRIVFTPVPFQIETGPENDQAETVQPEKKSERKSQDEIMSVIGAAKPKLNLCYQAHKSENPQLRGKMQIELLISPSGHIQNISTTNSQWSAPLTGEEIERCVRQRLSRIQFPPQQQEQRAKFSLTFM